MGYFKPFRGECGAFMMYVACMMHSVRMSAVFCGNFALVAIEHNATLLHLLRHLWL